MSKTPRENPNKNENSGGKQDRHSAFMLPSESPGKEDAKAPFDEWNQESRRRSNTEIDDTDTVEADFVMNTEGDEYQPKAINLEALGNNEDEFSGQSANEESDGQMKRMNTSGSTNEKLIQSNSPVQQNKNVDMKLGEMSESDRSSLVGKTRSTPLGTDVHLSMPRAGTMMMQHPSDPFGMNQ